MESDAKRAFIVLLSMGLVVPFLFSAIADFTDSSLFNITHREGFLGDFSNLIIKVIVGNETIDTNYSTISMVENQWIYVNVSVPADDDYTLSVLAEGVEDAIPALDEIPPEDSSNATVLMENLTSLGLDVFTIDEDESSFGKGKKSKDYGVYVNVTARKVNRTGLVLIFGEPELPEELNLSTIHPVSIYSERLVQGKAEIGVPVEWTIIARDTGGIEKNYTFTIPREAENIQIRLLAGNTILSEQTGVRPFTAEELSAATGGAAPEDKNSTYLFILETLGGNRHLEITYETPAPVFTHGWVSSDTVVAGLSSPVLLENVTAQISVTEDEAENQRIQVFRTTNGIRSRVESRLVDTDGDSVPDSLEWVTPNLKLENYNITFGSISFNVVDSRGHVHESRVVVENNGAETTLSTGQSLPESGIEDGIYDVTLIPRTYDAERGEPVIENYPIEDIVFENLVIDSNFTGDLRIENLESNNTPFGSNAKRVYAIDPTALNFTEATVRVEPARGSELRKCAEWDFDLQVCNGEWITVMTLTPGQEYTFILTPDDPCYAEYNTTLTAPRCNDSESPCYANSSLLMSARTYSTPEPNQPNTVDTCIDGINGITYTSDESIENITVTTLNGTTFNAGDTVNVLIWYYAFGTSDRVSVLYANSSTSPTWHVVGTGAAAGQGLYSYNVDFVLNDSTGEHAVRALIADSAPASTTCGSGYADNDDVAFQVDAAEGQTSINVSNCTRIDTNGTYIMNTSISGANESAALPGNACIVIDAANVSFSCSNYDLTNNGTTGVTYGIFINSTSENVQISNCPRVSEFTHGIYIHKSDDVDVGPSWFCNNTNGIVVNQSNNSVFTSVYGCNNSETGIHIVDSLNTSLDPSYFYNNTNGILVDDSNTTDFTDVSSRGNSGNGIQLLSSRDTTMTDCILYDNGMDFKVNNSLASSADVNLTRVLFYRPAGDTTNYTNITMNDSVAASSSYFMNWSAQPASPPGSNLSIAGKYLNISVLSGTVSIDKIVWSWLDADSTLINESTAMLLKYNSSGWSVQNDTPDTSGNKLSLSNLNPTSVFGPHAKERSDQDAVYSTALGNGAPNCTNSKSPCQVQSSLIYSWAGAFSTVEPHAPSGNTIDSCGDDAWSNLGYMSDHSVEAYNITTLSGTTFNAGDTINVSIAFYGSVMGGDSIELYYANSSTSLDWQKVDNYTVPGFGGYQTWSFEFVLNDTAGEHAVRVLLRNTMDALGNCSPGMMGPNDRDDATFQVESSGTPITDCSDITSSGTYQLSSDITGAGSSIISNLIVVAV